MEWIANSSKVLFELCPGTTHKLVAHTGPQKDLKNVKNCLKLLNEAGEDIPRFVSHHLDELPPVTFRRERPSPKPTSLERAGECSFPKTMRRPETARRPRSARKTRARGWRVQPRAWTGQPALQRETCMRSGATCWLPCPGPRWSRGATTE